MAPRSDGLPVTITANVNAEHGSEFSADLANLGPHSLFIKAASGLEFRESVTVKFNGITVHGEVAFVCREPPGAVVVFNATPEAVNVIEDLMDDVEVVIGASAPPPPVSWEDNTSVSDDSDPEDPTNPALKPVKLPVHVEEHIYETSGSDEEAEVRAAFARTLPPNYATEPLGPDVIQRLSATVEDSPTVDVKRDDAEGEGESTLVPEAARARARTVVQELETTDHGLDAITDEPASDPSLDARRGDFDESTEFP